MKTKLVLIVLAALLTLKSTDIFAGTSTAQRTIEGIHVKKDGYFYFTSKEGNWSSAGCENAKYVLVDGNTSVVEKEILSVALSAKLAGKKVYFLGECHTDLNYYSAHSIWML